MAGSLRTHPEVWPTSSRQRRLVALGLGEHSEFLESKQSCLLMVSGAGGMDAMRERLLEEQAFTHAARTQELTAQLNDTARLASALTRLQTTEEQLRTLQATLIAERVARTQIQRDASSRAEDVRDYREELASAVRALHRARDEGKKSEEDRRALTRAYETAQAK